LEIRWSKAENATRYRVLVHTAALLPAGADGQIDPTALAWWKNIEPGGRSTMVPSDQLAAATVYYLWVQAQINGRWISAASTPRKFTTRLVAPTELTSGTQNTVTPTLTWTSPDALGWVVQIRTGSATTAEQFAALPLLHTSGVLTAATYTVPGSLLTADTTYSYTVTARDVAVGVPGCEVASLPAVITALHIVAYAHLRIGGASWEQGIVRQSDNAVLSSINSEFGDPSPSAQNFTLTFDKVARTVTLAMSNNGGQNSVYSLPVDRWTSETAIYSLLLEIYATTQPGQAELSNLSLAVTGATPMAFTSLLAVQPGDANAAVTGQLGKGFVLSGTITFTWSATKPVNSQYQAMVRF
jgi:hypothetical protein